MEFILRPSVISSENWYPERLARREWDRIRKQVLERDDYTCAGCSHRALKWMNVHHVGESHNDSLDNLVPVCVACHAVLHLGRNLSLGTLQVWASPVSQVEIIRQTRKGIGEGRSLPEINKGFSLKRGHHPPDSIDWANDLLRSKGDKPRGYLDEPFSAVFLAFKKWQLEDAS